MKTTIEISDSLMKEVRQFAAKHSTTFRELVETSLREILTKRNPRRGAFSLKNGTFKGSGLQAGLSEGDWSRVRALIYEDQGG